MASSASTSEAQVNPTKPYVAPRYARPLFILNAAVAWFAVALSLSLNLTGYYVDTLDPTRPTLLGNVPDGIDTPIKRFFDWITYFTIWSNTTVAVVMTVLATRPNLFLRKDQVGGIWRTLRLDSVLMITVTGVVFNLLLAESGKQGLDWLSNNMLHVITPLLTFVVFVIAGPRGLLNVRVVFAALILPLIWAGFALARGAIIVAYPYPFLDAATNGWGPVFTFVIVIIVFAIILSFIFWGIDALIRRLFHARSAG